MRPRSSAFLHVSAIFPSTIVCKNIAVKICCLSLPGTPKKKSCVEQVFVARTKTLSFSAITSFISHCCLMLVKCLNNSRIPVSP